MERKIFEPEHDAFRETARRFYEKECLPNRQQWERDGVTSREVWLRAGELGLLGWEAPEKYGGQGLKDFRYNAILTEEKHATGAVGPGLGLQNDVMPSYLIGLTTGSRRSGGCPATSAARSSRPSRCPNPARAPTWPGSAPPPSGTAIITSSTARRRLSAAASWPISS